MITTRMKTFSIYGLFSLCLLPLLLGQAPKDETGSGVCIDLEKLRFRIW